MSQRQSMLRHANTSMNVNSLENDFLLRESKSAKNMKPTVYRAKTKEFDNLSKKESAKAKRNDTTIIDFQESHQSSNRKILTGSSFYGGALDKQDKTYRVASISPSKDVLDFKEVIERNNNGETETKLDSKVTVDQVMNFLETLRLEEERTRIEKKKFERIEVRQDKPSIEQQFEKYFDKRETVYDYM